MCGFLFQRTGTISAAAAGTTVFLLLVAGSDERSPLLLLLLVDLGNLAGFSGGNHRHVSLGVGPTGSGMSVRGFGVAWSLLWGVFRRLPSLTRSPLSRQGRSDSRERGLSLTIRAPKARESLLCYYGPQARAIDALLRVRRNRKAQGTYNG